VPTACGCRSATGTTSCSWPRTTRRHRRRSRPFRREAGDLGFKIRGLVTDATDKTSKGTRILGHPHGGVAPHQVVPRDPKNIDLTGKYRDEMVKILREKKVTSISHAQKVSPSKCVSKVFLRRLVERKGTDHGQDRGLTPTATPMAPASAEPETLSGDVKSSTQGESYLSLPGCSAGSGVPTSDRIDMEPAPTPSYTATGETLPAAETTTTGDSPSGVGIVFVDPTASSPASRRGNTNSEGCSRGVLPPSAPGNPLHGF
jgi:hypothetical protein